MLAKKNRERMQLRKESEAEAKYESLLLSKCLLRWKYLYVENFTLFRIHYENNLSRQHILQWKRFSSLCKLERIHLQRLRENRITNQAFCLWFNNAKQLSNQRLLDQKIERKVQELTVWLENDWIE